MQKKLMPLIQGVQIVLIILIISACGGSSSDHPKPDTPQTPASSESQDSNIPIDGLIEFEKTLTLFIEDLEELPNNNESIPTDKLIDSYQRLSSELDFLDQTEKKLFEELEYIENIELNASSQDIGALLQTLIDMGVLDPQNSINQYTDDINNELIEFLRRTKEKVIKRRNPESEGSITSRLTSITSDLKKTTMQNYIFSSLLGLALLAVTAGLAIAILRLRKKMMWLDRERSRLKSEIQNTRQDLNKQANKHNELLSEVTNLSVKLAKMQPLDSASATAIRNEPVTRSINPTSYSSQSFSTEIQDQNIVTKSELPNLSDQKPNIMTSSSPPLYLRLVKQYNDKASSLAPYAAGVSQTEESLKRNLQDSSQTSVILAHDNNPNYWVIKDEASNFWLFPREGWEPSIGTLESFVKLFTFTGNPSRRYRVIKPASVIEVGQRDWSLRNPGEIEFC